MLFIPQTVIPFATTLAYSALTIYFLVKRGLHENMDRLLALYLLLALVWSSGQVLVYSGIPEPVPAFRWDRTVIYGLVVLSVAFWAFARVFLQKEDWMPVGWLVGLSEGVHAWGGVSEVIEVEG